jgi:hypothetical protein
MEAASSKAKMRALYTMGLSQRKNTNCCHGGMEKIKGMLWKSFPPFHG